MSYYVRKISRSKWQENPLSNDAEEAKKEVSKVSADAITNCIKTTENKLSVWKLEEKTDSIDDVIPLIVSFEKPDKCDVIYIDDETFKNSGLRLEQSSIDANTPIEEFKQFHYNVVVNDYEGLGNFAKIVLQSLGNHRRFTQSDVKKKIKAMIEEHEIERDLLSEGMINSIESVNNFV